MAPVSTAMGYVMEYLYARDSASQIDEFERGILPLIKCTAWTGGNWHFPDGEVRPWNGVQNVGGEIRKLTDYLLRVIRNAPASSPILSMQDLQVKNPSSNRGPGAFLWRPGFHDVLGVGANAIRRMSTRLGSIMDSGTWSSLSAAPGYWSNFRPSPTGWVR